MVPSRYSAAVLVWMAVSNGCSLLGLIVHCNHRVSPVVQMQQSLSVCWTNTCCWCTLAVCQSCYVQFSAFMHHLAADAGRQASSVPRGSRVLGSPSQRSSTPPCRKTVSKGPVPDTPANSSPMLPRQVLEHLPASAAMPATCMPLSATMFRGHCYHP